MNTGEPGSRGGAGARDEAEARALRPDTPGEGPGARPRGDRAAVVRRGASAAGAAGRGGGGPPPERVESQGVEVCFVGSVELIPPAGGGQRGRTVHRPSRAGASPHRVPCCGCGRADEGTRRRGLPIHLGSADDRSRRTPDRLHAPEVHGGSPGRVGGGPLRTGRVAPPVPSQPTIRLNPTSSTSHRPLSARITTKGTTTARPFHTTSTSTRAAGLPRPTTSAADRMR